MEWTAPAWESVPGGIRRRAAAAFVLALVAIGTRAPARDEPGSPAAARQYAVAVGFQTRNLDKLAIEEWRKFLAEFPKDPRRDGARHGLGVCLLRDGQFDAAIAELSGLIAASPQYAQLGACTSTSGWRSPAARRRPSSPATSTPRCGRSRRPCRRTRRARRRRGPPSRAPRPWPWPASSRRRPRAIPG
jgi:TolA-binding protein